MMQQWLFIQQKLQQQIPVMLLYVLESNGSSPGRQGFNMAVSADNEMSGSIGGGIMEHKFVELAKARMSESDDWSMVQKQIHDKAAGSNQSGMICSGEQTIFIYKCKTADLPVIGQIIDSISNFKNGNLTLSADGIQFSEQPPLENYYFEQTGDEEFIFREKTGFKNILHIVGGGHCALALSQLMSQLDFFIHVYDERTGLNTMQQNVFAHLASTIKDYADISQIIEEGKNVYVVIMSFGYRTDAVAIKALWGKQFKYIGLLGSVKKIEKLFAEFAEEGLDAAYGNNIHTPIGLSIHSKTPTEIAISIAAEIIAVKNQP